jgi:Ubiquitin-2 like Rad60 SUMO-like
MFRAFGVSGDVYADVSDETSSDDDEPLGSDVDLDELKQLIGMSKKKKKSKKKKSKRSKKRRSKKRARDESDATTESNAKKQDTGLGTSLGGDDTLNDSSILELFTDDDDDLRVVDFDKKDDDDDEDDEHNNSIAMRRGRRRRKKTAFVAIDVDDELTDDDDDNDDSDDDQDERVSGLRRIVNVEPLDPDVAGMLGNLGSFAPPPSLALDSDAVARRLRQQALEKQLSSAEKLVTARDSKRSTANDSVVLDDVPDERGGQLLRVMVRVVGGNGKSLHEIELSINGNARLQQLLESVTDMIGRDADGTQLMLDGFAVDLTQSADEVGLIDDSELELAFEQRASSLLADTSFGAVAAKKRAAVVALGDNSDDDDDSSDDDDDVERIVVAVQTEKSRQRFRMDSNALFGELVRAYCDKNGFDASKLELHFDDEALDHMQSPADVDMEDGDIVDAMHAVPAPLRPSGTAANLGTFGDDDDDDGRFTVFVQQSSGDKQQFRMLPSDPFSKLAAAFCRKNALAEADVELHFDGEALAGRSTPEDVDMDDEDVVDAVVKVAAAPPPSTAVTRGRKKATRARRGATTPRARGRPRGSAATTRDRGRGAAAAAATPRGTRGRERGSRASSTTQVATPSGATTQATSNGFSLTVNDGNGTSAVSLSQDEPLTTLVEIYCAKHQLTRRQRGSVRLSVGDQALSSDASARAQSVPSGSEILIESSKRS